MVTAELIEKLEKLSPDLQSKVEETVDQLLTKKIDNIENNDPEIKSGFGGAKGIIIYMSEDFDEPLDEFKEYM